jgi:prepilin peptidase CpaA
VNWVVSIAVVIGLAASIEDLARRQVSNWISASALVAGIGYHSAVSGWRGGLMALGAAVAGFAVFLVFYCLGGMGGGDVKLMAGFGAVLGTVSRLLEAALWTAAVGGMLALAVISFQSMRRAMRRYFGSCQLSQPAREIATPSNESIPYAPAITLGAWLALVPKG